MWRRVYLLLVLVRLWFALSPSYLHPDENFQGPEVIAGKSLEFPSLLFFPAVCVEEGCGSCLSGVHGLLLAFSQCAQGVSQLCMPKLHLPAS